MLEVVTQRTGVAIVLLGFIQYYTLYNYLVFLPHLLSESFGLSSSQKGLSFLPLSLCIVLGSFLGGRLQEKWDRREFLLVTSSSTVLATLLYVCCSSFSLPLILASTALFGLCLGLSLPVQTTLLATIFQGKRARPWAATISPATSEWRRARCSEHLCSIGRPCRVSVRRRGVCRGGRVFLASVSPGREIPANPLTHPEEKKKDRRPKPAVLPEPNKSPIRQTVILLSMDTDSPGRKMLSPVREGGRSRLGALVTQV